MKRIITTLIMATILVGNIYSFDIEKFYWSFKDFEMSERLEIGYQKDASGKRETLYARWAMELFEVDINQYYLMFGNWGVQLVDVYDTTQFAFTIMLPKKENGTYFSLSRYIIIEKDPIGSPPVEELYFDESGTIFFRSTTWDDFSKNYNSSYHTFLVPWEGERLPDNVIGF